MPSLGIGALDVLLEWQHIKQVNDAWHDTYTIISLPLFDAMKAQKCFTIRLVLFNQNVSMKVLCIFLFFVFHRNEPNIFCCIFSFRSALFFMRTVCGFQINAVFWIAPEPTSLSSEKKCAGSISLLVFLWMMFCHDFSQVCSSLRNLPRRYIANLP